MRHNLWAWWKHWSDRQRLIMVMIVFGPIGGLIAALTNPYPVHALSFFGGVIVGAMLTLGVGLTGFAATTQPPEEGEQEHE